ncbi:hypothetical protein [Streptomyces sp. C10-9-1]|uniref:hypothetical protein n=1 Tax=Streptomyces sp. C10-9-1 TaxID=1859285 RepID=UPI003F49B610
MPGFDTLIDDFDDGTVDTVKWSQSYGDPIEEDGRAKVPCTTGYAGLRSASSYTLADSGLFLRIYPPAAGGATSAAASIFVQTTTGGTDAGILIDAAQNAVGLYLREGYADGAAVFLTYDVGDHAWIRIREDAGTLYWDTSSDGLTWTNRRTATSPAWASDETLSVVIEGHRDAGTADYVQADNFNVAPYTVVTAAAALTGDTTLTAAGHARRPAAAAPTATGELAGTGTAMRAAAAPLTAATSLTSGGQRTTSAAATGAAAPGLAAAGHTVRPAAASGTTAATLTAAAQRTATAGAVGTAAAAATALGYAARPATAAPTANAALTAAPTRRTHSTTTLTATAVLTARPAGTVLNGLRAGPPRTRWRAGAPRT